MCRRFVLSSRVVLGRLLVFVGVRVGSIGGLGFRIRIGGRGRVGGSLFPLLGVGWVIGILWLLFVLVGRF